MGLSFEEAIANVKQGQPSRRAVWSKYSYIEYSNGTVIHVHAHEKDPLHGPIILAYCPSTKDMTINDWENKET